MADNQRLKLRFLAALIPFGIATSACGGNTDGDGGSGGSGGTGGSGGEGGTAGSAGAPIDAGVGGTAGAPSCELYGTPEEECYARGPNGCAPYQGMQNSCCNPAIALVEKGDQCCYTFCVGACCGRAFVVEGAPRLPAVMTRGDWLAELDGESRELDPATSRALSAAWLEDARMEHASIASFARFTLELVALGAPPDLIAAAQRASLDEIEHARLCFALASRFAGAPLGPGALDVGPSELRQSLEQAAVAAFVEGCVGETIAALTAREQLELATDPDTRRALEVIARDEEAHAELAWRFVAWASRLGGAAVTRAISSALDRLLRAPYADAVVAAPPGVNVRLWQQFGRMTAGARERVARLAIVDVIAPCARALVGEPEARLPAAM